MSGFAEAGRPLLLPTAYFPPLAYYACLAGGRDIIIEQKETFPKQTYRNRCEIMTVSGKTTLIVPVTKPDGNHTRSENILISYREPWQRTHWRALETAYNSSPFFLYYSGRIRILFEMQESSLIQYNDNILRCLNELIGINPSISYSDNYIKSPVDMQDLRNVFTPKKEIPGMDYPSYMQVFRHIHGFLAGLSILDLLFHLGPDSKKYLDNIFRQLAG
jgi:hypothetical protein